MINKEIIDVKSKSLEEIPRMGNQKKFIAVHYLGVVGQNNALSPGGYGAHYFIYWDGTIYQACDHDAVLWQVGTAGYYTQKHPEANNYNTIGIEMCVKCDGDKSKADDPYWYFTEETQEACAWLVQKIMTEENIPIENVLRHHDIVNKYCPAPYVTNNKYKTNWTWNEFLQKVQGIEISPSIPYDRLYRVRKSWSDDDSQIGAYSILENAIEACIEGFTVYDWNGKAVYGENFGKEESAKLYRVRVSWDSPETQIGAYADLENAKAACKLGFTVYDWDGNVVYSNPILTINAKYYRVRKSWEDASSQLGAYLNLHLAKVNCPIGYGVYDWLGNLEYYNEPVKEEEKVEAEKLYLVAKDINDESSYVERYKDVEVARKECPLGYYVYDWNGNVVYKNFDEYVEPEQPPVEEEKKYYRVRKSWEDSDSQIGAYEELQNAINACAPGYKVYDWNGDVVYDNDKAIPDDRLYRVRQKWENEFSEIDAYPNLETAIANCPKGYHVYDDHGTIVYTATEDLPVSPLKGISQEGFIAYIGPKAHEDMKESCILASVTIAQAILESGWGQTELALNANNLFGMKTNLSGNTWESAWDGKKYTKKTNEEYKEGEITVITADFRAYDSVDASIKDHSDYLRQAMNGNKLRYEGLCGETDYKVAIQTIKDGGYATDSKYVNKIINIIEKYELYEWDIIEEEPKTPEVVEPEIPDTEKPTTPENPEAEVPEVPEGNDPELPNEEPITPEVPEEKETLLDIIINFIKKLFRIIFRNK